MADDWIWDDYAAARSAFLGAATSRSGLLFTERLPGQSGRHGEPLSMDAIRIGTHSPQRLLLVLSGVHGFEGPAGSAVQATVLRKGLDLPDDTAAVFVHAVNPYGYSHWSRSTEENVDLNRSFVDRSKPLPVNPGYRDFHPYFCPERMDNAAMDRARSFIEAYEVKYGADKASSAIGAGQYEFPDGLYYGGQKRPWAVNALLKLIDATVSRERLKNVALVDLHTGRGDFGEPFFLNFDSPGTQEFEQAAMWWGTDALLSKDELGSKYQDTGPPPRHGLVLRGLRHHLAPATLAGCVVEFGTYDLWTMYRAELADRWVRFRSQDYPEVAEGLRLEAFRAFNPEDDAWRRSVLSVGPQIVFDAVRGLSRWPVPVAT